MLESLGAARAEVLDFEVMLWPLTPETFEHLEYLEFTSETLKQSGKSLASRLRDAFLRDPLVSFELSEAGNLDVCRLKTWKTSFL